MPQPTTGTGSGRGKRRGPFSDELPGVMPGRCGTVPRRMTAWVKRLVPGLHRRRMPLHLGVVDLVDAVLHHEPQSHALERFKGAAELFPGHLATIDDHIVRRPVVDVGSSRPHQTASNFLTGEKNTPVRRVRRDLYLGDAFLRDVEQVADLRVDGQVVATEGRDGGETVPAATLDEFDPGTAGVAVHREHEVVCLPVRSGDGHRAGWGGRIREPTGLQRTSRGALSAERAEPGKDRTRVGRGAVVTLLHGKDCTRGLPATAVGTRSPRPCGSVGPTVAARIPTPERS